MTATAMAPVTFSTTPAPNKNAETLEALRNLLYSDDKPKWFKTIDALLLSYLVLRMADDHEIFDSQHTLATRFGCDTRTISASVKRLKSHGWVTSRSRKYTSSALAINRAMLPQERTRRLLPSDDAKELAEDALNVLRQLNPKRRYTKAAITREVINAERIIGHCGSYEVAFEVVKFALMSDRWHERVKRVGLHAVNMNCAKIRAELSRQGGAKM